MTEQVCFEDVVVGMEIPPLVKQPGHVQLFLFSSVTRNPHRIHYDRDFAALEGHPDLLVHGPLQGAFLVQMLTDWISPGGWLKKIAHQNRARAFVGDTITSRGKVTRVYVEDGENLVDCDIWNERQTGEVCAPGTATVWLPSRE